MSLSTSRRILAEEPAEVVQELFLRSTFLADFKPKDLGKSSKELNFHKLRERVHIDPLNTTNKGLHNSRSLGLRLSSYANHFADKPNVDLQLNRDMAATFQGSSPSKAAAVRLEAAPCSSYAADFAAGCSRPHEPPKLLEPEDNALGGLIGPAGGPVPSLSHSRSEFSAGKLIAGLRPTICRLQDHLGVSQQPGKDWRSTYRAEFSLTAPARRKATRQRGILRALSATGLEANELSPLELEEAQRLFRAQMLRSQYGQAFSGRSGMPAPPNWVSPIKPMIYDTVAKEATKSVGKGSSPASPPKRAKS